MGRWIAIFQFLDDWKEVMLKYLFIITQDN